MGNLYRKNQLVRITTVFTVSGVDTDPSTVTLTVQDPSGNSDVYTYALGQVTKDSTGHYHKDITADEEGHWWYQWKATGAVEAVDEDHFEVTSQIPPEVKLYCNLAEVQAAMPDVNMGSSYDAILDALCLRASRLIDGYFGRKPGAFSADTDETRYYTGSGCAEQWIDELAAAPTSVSIAETGSVTVYTALVATDYYLWPDNAALDGIPYMRLDLDRLNGTRVYWPQFRKSVKVVGKFGFSTTPPDEIRQAAIIQVAKWFKRGQQAFADTGAIVELGQLRYTQKLDPDVEQILSEPKLQRLTV